MTVVVTVKVTDGIVLAADSAASFFDENGVPIKIYNNANKIFNLIKVWPIGAMVYGAGGIGTTSVETLSKDLRRRLRNPEDADYGLNRDNYTVSEVADKARLFLYEENYLRTYDAPPEGFFLDRRAPAAAALFRPHPDRPRCAASQQTPFYFNSRLTPLTTAANEAAVMLRWRPTPNSLAPPPASST